ncbi:unnamed protein product [Linum tenue]|uniref:Uncharacterized protein n=1 Tax=Linum tenue TaxID=586396 RepID=A0AAV0MII4_9ROSI|nr:unnamed protein product [Linum tenue]
MEERSYQAQDVTSKDLLSSDNTVVPVDFYEIAGDDSSEQKGVMIVKLRRVQELRLGAITRKCIGKDQAKCSPAATVTFMYEPEIKINEDMMARLSLEEKQSIVESSPTKVFDIDPTTQQIASKWFCFL